MQARSVRPLLSFLLVFTMFACADELPLDQSGGSLAAPQLDHTTLTPNQVVDANNYHLEMTPNNVGSGFFHGERVFFSGQVAYGTDATHVFYYNTRGTSQSFEPAGIAPFVERGGAHANHHTATLTVESDDQRLGFREHLNILTIRESFAWSSAPDDDYVIVRYTLVNPTASDITGLHLGYFADADVTDDAGANVTEYDASLEAAITYNPASPLRSAYVLLDQAVAGYQHWVNPWLGLSPDLTDPETNEGWFELLTAPSDAGSLGEYDVRNALTAQPVTLPAGESITISVAMVAGADDTDLAANVAAARARFAGLAAPLPHARPVPVAVVPGDAVFTATFTFPDAALAAAFVAGDAACAMAPITSASIDGAVVAVEFDRLDMNPLLLPGDPVRCAGRLADGSYFTGYDSPELADPRIYLTPVVTETSADWAPTWSPDGHTIAYSTNRDGTRAIWLLDTAVPGAEPVKLTSGSGGAELTPDWSPDGREIVFSRSGGIFAVEVATGAERQITRTQAERSFEVRDLEPRWSPDGSQIVVWRTVAGWSALEPKGDNIFVLPASGDLDGTAAVALSQSFGIYPEWAADGLVYFTGLVPPDGGAAWRVYTVDPAGGAPIAATPVEPSQNRHPALSPGGGTLAFTSGSRLILQDNALERHTVAQLAPSVWLNALGNQQNLEFAPDGARLLLVTNDGNIYIADVSPLLDPVARAEGLAASVQSLIDAGVLDGAGGASLIASLEDVATKLENGQIGAALNRVNAYINQVNALINSRRLGEIEGQQLIDGGNALADQIGG